MGRNNSFYLSGKTIIKCFSGNIKIKDIDEGDFAFTRKGYKKILDLFWVEAKETKRYNFNGRNLRCTNNCKVITIKNEIEKRKTIGAVSPEDAIYFLTKNKNPLLLNTLLTKATPDMITRQDAVNEKVYNLVIDGQPEFFANGILIGSYIR